MGWFNGMAHAHIATQWLLHLVTLLAAGATFIIFHSSWLPDKVEQLLPTLLQSLMIVVLGEVVWMFAFQKEMRKGLIFVSLAKPLHAIKG